MTEHAEEIIKDIEKKASKESEEDIEKEQEELKLLKVAPEVPESTEIKDESGKIDRDLMTARSNPEFQKLAYCSKCKMTNHVKKGKCTVCGGKIE